MSYDPHKGNAENYRERAVVINDQIALLLAQRKDLLLWADEEDSKAEQEQAGLAVRDPLSIKCDFCHAIIGEPCAGPLGQKVRPHAPRRVWAELVTERMNVPTTNKEQEK